MYTLPAWLLFARSTALDRLDDLLISRFPAEAAPATNGVTASATRVSPRISDEIFKKRGRDDTTVSFKGFPFAVYMPG